MHPQKGYAVILTNPFTIWSDGNYRQTAASAEDHHSFSLDTKATKAQLAHQAA
jgi:hypothetical protein